VNGRTDLIEENVMNRMQLTHDSRPTCQQFVVVQVFHASYHARGN